MRLAYTPYALPHFAAAAVSFLLALYAWRRRGLADCVSTLALLALANTWFALGYALELMGVDLVTKAFLGRLQYPALAALTPLVLVFSLRYAGLEEALSRRNRLVLAGGVLVFSLLALTDGVHHLVWTQVTLAPLGAGSALVIQHGPAFWVYVFWGHALLLVALSVLGNAALGGSAPYRRQGVVFMLALLLPMLANLAYTTHGYSPVEHWDPSPVALSLSLLVLGVAIFRFGLLDLVPVTRRTLIERMPDGVLLVDGSGRITDVNPAFVRDVGAEGMPLIGLPAERVLQDSPALAAAVQSTTDLELEVFLGEGAARREYAVSVSPIGNGRRLIILRDVTDLKRLQAQFLQTQKMETVGRLAGGVAHDFNNLMTAIAGYAQLVQLGLPQDDPARQDLDRILRCTERAARLTHQLLAFSRRYHMAAQLYDLNRLVRGMDRMLSSLLGESVALVIDLAPDLGLVRIDRSQIEQVLVNLVSNSGDALPERGTVTVRTTNSEDNAWVLLEVSDNGVGMDEEVKAHLFEPFFSTKEPGAGTGLGLATASGIVQQHQGQIEVESAVGQGTLVRIRLPRAEGVLSEEPGSAGEDDLQPECA